MIVYDKFRPSGAPNGNWKSAMKYVKKGATPDFVSEIMVNTVEYIKHMERKVTSPADNNAVSPDVNIRSVSDASVVSESLGVLAKYSKAWEERATKQMMYRLDDELVGVGQPPQGECDLNVYNEKGFVTTNKIKDSHWFVAMPKMKGTPIINGPATTVFWKDGSKTTVICHKDDVFVPYLGVAIAHMKRMYGPEWARMHKIRKAARDRVYPALKDAS